MSGGGLNAISKAQAKSGSRSLEPRILGVVIVTPLVVDPARDVRRHWDPWTEAPDGLRQSDGFFVGRRAERRRIPRASHEGTDDDKTG